MQCRNNIFVSNKKYLILVANLRHKVYLTYIYVLDQDGQIIFPCSRWKNHYRVGTRFNNTSKFDSTCLKIVKEINPGHVM